MTMIIMMCVYIRCISSPQNNKLSLIHSLYIIQMIYFSVVIYLQYFLKLCFFMPLFARAFFLPIHSNELLIPINRCYNVLRCKFQFLVACTVKHFIHFLSHQLRRLQFTAWGIFCGFFRQRQTVGDYQGEPRRKERQRCHIEQ